MSDSDCSQSFVLGGNWQLSGAKQTLRSQLTRFPAKPHNRPCNALAGTATHMRSRAGVAATYPNRPTSMAAPPISGACSLRVMYRIACRLSPLAWWTVSLAGGHPRLRDLSRLIAQGSLSPSSRACAKRCRRDSVRTVSEACRARSSSGPRATDAFACRPLWRLTAARPKLHGSPGAEPAPVDTSPPGRSLADRCLIAPQLCRAKPRPRQRTEDRLMSVEALAA